MRQKTDPTSEPTGTITRLEPQHRRPSRVAVYIDDEFAFPLSVEVLESSGLGVGDTVTQADRIRLLSEEECARALARVDRLLSYRPRSESEVRRRLREAGFAPETIDAAVERLRKVGLVDDAAFARYWVENRAEFRPRGARIVEAELRSKGVDREVAREALAQDDLASPEEQAYRVAVKMAGRLAGESQNVFRQRVSAFLGRRGFDYDVVASVTKRLWGEIQGEEGFP
jgi:regulatory protein